MPAVRETSPIRQKLSVTSERPEAAEAGRSRMLGALVPELLFCGSGLACGLPAAKRVSVVRQDRSERTGAAEAGRTLEVCWTRRTALGGGSYIVRSGMVWPAPGACDGTQGRGHRVVTGIALRTMPRPRSQAACGIPRSLEGLG
jgi:hypothetical protein